MINNIMQIFEELSPTINSSLYMEYLLTFVIPLNKLQSVEHIFNTQKQVLSPLTPS
ncbi:hypothetical protein C0J52_23335 [Blattella germanica]|nr:hypothetical protein C0J52_23335 [Blattella germanica]